MYILYSAARRQAAGAAVGAAAALRHAARLHPAHAHSQR